ncbi:hypothetical protein [Myxococcus fulvus]|uniref:hypothetical protein n=1 Tax=Myxococcus fulvus TaxID=33 RepID=UPI0020C0F8EE|nr:hypothetical protein [Myxococcus fulvus]MCK8503577.1 hypothetical protein [Myxococcus fulvus]
MPSTNIEKFIEHLRESNQAVVLLGQELGRSGRKLDPILDAYARQFEPDVDALTCNILLRSRSAEDIEATLAWLNQRSQRLASPESLNAIAAVAWNGVYTSAIYSDLRSVFSSPLRTVESIYGDEFRPRDLRSPAKLHVTYLFGAVDRTEKLERPPLTKLELAARRPIANRLLARIPEHVSAVGVLAVDYYDPRTDWLRPEDLYGVISAMGMDRVFFFNANEALLQDEHIAALLESGTARACTESLAEVLSSAVHANLIPKLAGELESHGSRVVRIQKKAVQVPKDIWFQASKNATVLTSSILSDSPTPTSEVRLRELRRFFAESAVHPVWTAYEMKLWFERDFEKKLHELVSSKLRTSGSSEPLILHGQASSGKSVGLGALAFKQLRAAEVPVLFIGRRLAWPAIQEIDDFCKWAEDSGANVSLIIWDGNYSPTVYGEMLRALQGRGRNVVLVGSSYRFPSARGSSFVEAPAAFSAEESSRFKQYLESLGYGMETLVGQRNRKLDPEFLAALFWFLPETRSTVRSSVSDEASTTERLIRERIHQLPEESGQGIMAAALRRAGLLGSDVNLGAQSDVNSLDAATLTSLIAIPSQVDLPVPVDVLVRTLGALAVRNFAEIFRDIDLVRWDSEPSGNITLSIRTRLEARLIAQGRAGSAEQEILLAKRLLEGVRHSNSFAGGNEVEFASELVRRLGPNGPLEKRYRHHYLKLAAALTELRRNGIEDTRLMLQEASLMREAIRENLEVENGIAADAVLAQAEEILHEALLSVPVGPRSKKHRSRLLVELASVIGARAHQLARIGGAKADVMTRLKRSRKFALEARALDPEHYHPVDVIAWTACDVKQFSDLSPVETAELLADVTHAFELVQVNDLPFDQQQLFYERQTFVGQSLGSEDLTEESLRRLDEMGSTAGHYLRARMLAGDTRSEGPLTSERQQGLEKALEYLASVGDQVLDDGRCQYLKLRVWWLLHTGRPLFVGERQPIPFDTRLRMTCLEMAHGLMALGTIYQEAPIRHLSAVLSWTLERYEDAKRIWSELQLDTDYASGRKRVAKTFIVTDGADVPTVYSGTIQWVSPDENAGQVLVDRLRVPIKFSPRDFRLREIQKGQALPEFHVAFSYLGPFADPPRRTGFR